MKLNPNICVGPFIPIGGTMAEAMDGQYIEDWTEVPPEPPCRPRTVDSRVENIRRGARLTSGI